jgi:hypothetical protein
MDGRIRTTLFLSETHRVGQMNLGTKFQSILPHGSFHETGFASDHDVGEDW